MQAFIFYYFNYFFHQHKLSSSRGSIFTSSQNLMWFFGHYFIPLTFLPISLLKAIVSSSSEPYEVLSELELGLSLD